MSGHPSALRLIAQKLAETLRPADPLPLSEWMAANIVLVDGPKAGEKWSIDGAPYLAEIADCLSDDDPCNLVTVRKAQQTGASILALGWCLYIADREPANVLYGVPGLDALRDLNSGKLQPLIDAWQKETKKAVIAAVTQRSGGGSTTYEKVFPGGRLWLANANTVMDLSSKTIKKGVKDEVSKWQTLPDGADSEKLFFGRFTAFRREKSWKILEISTPEIDSGDDTGEAEGHCRIDRSFRRSDQRFWNCTCPECTRLFVHRFDRFRINADHPHRSTYECLCGHHITEAERVTAVRGGRWIPSVDEEGRHPGFHIDAFISLMMSYEAIAHDFLEAKKESEKKAYANVVLGLPYRYKGDAPDYVKLLQRCETGLVRGHVPDRGLILVGSADVQMRGIWFEVTAYAANRESWTVEARYIPGDTSDPNGEAFTQLRKEVLDRGFPDPWGRLRKVDAMGVDSGYRANTVYAWVRQNQRVHPDTGREVILAVKGEDGWGRPAIGTPTLVDIDLDGRKVKQGCKLWAIGTWPLKADFYSDLRLEGVRSGHGTDPDGYCHFGDWLDAVYFKQITAEHLEDIKVRGRVTGSRWVPDRENHLLDCRIYNRAMAEYLGLSTMTPAEWSALARHRGLPTEMTAVDLFTPAHLRPATPSPTPETPSSEGVSQVAAADVDDGWIKPRSDWMNR